MDQNVPSSFASDQVGTALGGAFREFMAADHIEPGDSPSYQIAKALYLYHPLGGKMVDAPIKLAQSQKRRITVGESPPEVARAFEREWERLAADAHIANAARLARMYGISSFVMGVEGQKPDKELDPTTLAGKKIWFTEWDPLNTAGSLVLDQIPTSPTFSRPVRVSSNGETYHPSRFVVAMNEGPVYLAYTDTAFGFVGRSVYQRALYPLKSFVRSMVADDMIQAKLGLLVASMQTPGPVVTKEMTLLQKAKAFLLRQAKTGQVLTVGKDETVQTLNMQNVDGAGQYSRTNILKNVATSADMPAVLLENETMVAGFGEGTEDAKNIARYVETFREWLGPLYRFVDEVARRRAWDRNFVETMQTKYPEAYRSKSIEEIYSLWREDFQAEWPSFLIEPESEQVRVDDVRLQAAVAVVQTLIDQVDPDSQLELLRFLADNVSSNRRLFPHALDFDYETLRGYLEGRAAQMEAAPKPGDEGGFPTLPPEAKKFGRFSGGDSLRKVGDAIARMDAEFARRPRRRVDA